MCFGYGQLGHKHGNCSRKGCDNSSSDPIITSDNMVGTTNDTPSHSRDRLETTSIGRLRVTMTAGLKNTIGVNKISE